MNKESIISNVVPKTDVRIIQDIRPDRSTVVAISQLVLPGTLRTGLVVTATTAQVPVEGQMSFGVTLMWIEKNDNRVAELILVIHKCLGSESTIDYSEDYGLFTYSPELSQITAGPNRLGTRQHRNTPKC